LEVEEAEREERHTNKEASNCMSRRKDFSRRWDLDENMQFPEGTPLYGLYRHVRSQGRVFQPLWPYIRYRFWPFWSMGKVPRVWLYLSSLELGMFLRRGDFFIRHFSRQLYQPNIADFGHE